MLTSAILVLVLVLPFISLVTLAKSLELHELWFLVVKWVLKCLLHRAVLGLHEIMHVSKSSKVNNSHKGT